MQEPSAIAISEIAYIGPHEDPANPAFYIRRKKSSEQIDVQLEAEALIRLPEMLDRAAQNSTAMKDPHGLVPLDVMRGEKTLPFLAASDQFSLITPANGDGRGCAIYLAPGCSLPSASPKMDTVSLSVTNRSSDVLERLAQRGHTILDLRTVKPQRSGIRPDGVARLGG